MSSNTWNCKFFLYNPIKTATHSLSWGPWVSVIFAISSQTLPFLLAKSVLCCWYIDKNMKWNMWIWLGLEYNILLLDIHRFLLHYTCCLCNDSQEYLLENLQVYLYENLVYIQINGQLLDPELCQFSIMHYYILKGTAANEVRRPTFIYTELWFNMASCYTPIANNSAV